MVGGDERDATDDVAGGALKLACYIQIGGCRLQVENTMLTMAMLWRGLEAPLAADEV